MPFTIVEVNNTAIDKLIEELIDCLEDSSNNAVREELIKTTLNEIQKLKNP